MVYINNKHEFITKVSQLYSETKDKHSIWMTFKKYTPKEQKPKSEKQQHFNSTKKSSSSGGIKKKQPQHEGCLIRVTNGKDKKYSTIVLYKDLATFQSHLFNILRDHLSASLKQPSSSTTTSSTGTATNTTTATTSATNTTTATATTDKKKKKKKADL
ncbi:hypothetical protein FDP41_007093 [Naegleria fowleri]|uniref:Signal recognition particle 14 kDa protein n=1 Tax=Naegleria fowleri TaxID=5763 RepID=A0A6A5BGD3_NAEFO|nr:uncharacterized protein FDP41_007093 [Naegleria fowleri]KAF0973706.1 hypothetical protein FDP41_007093 [Naegleria fowleri]CAG4710766.1 unnamed protein product [Naegleria fowleri]